MRALAFAVSLTLAAALGVLGALYYVERGQPTIEERARTVERQVRKIAQLATVEGHYGQIFNHREVGYLDFASFNKSVMVEADARVVMGFDLEGVRVVVDRDARELVVYDWPAPTELAFELDTRYFDLNQGMFNTFDERELNAVRAKFEAQLRRKVDYATLERESYEQAADLLAIVGENLAANGWALRVDGWPREIEIAVAAGDAD